MPTRDQPGQLYPRRRPLAGPPDLGARAAGPAGDPREALSLAARSNPNLISAGFTELAARDNIEIVRGQRLLQISATGTSTARSPRRPRPGPSLPRPRRPGSPSGFSPSAAADGRSSPEPFVDDSPLGRDGFEPSIPRQIFSAARRSPRKLTFRNINRLPRASRILARADIALQRG